ncbi:MAG: Hpt domain-containing protein [Alphaproteobacteria bacterium]|nr:Hpt domain-containing protein [Alphaproteobacteria bacterium]
MGYAFLMSAADEVLDLSQLLAAFGEIDDDVRKMMRIFIETTEPILDELEARVASRDRAGVEDLAHSAKGAARSAGARTMAAACEALEKAAEAGDWGEVERKLPAVRPTFVAAKAAIASL